MITCTTIDGPITTYELGRKSTILEVEVDTYSKKIELDPTTMKKIAMYNKSIELRDMLEDIKNTKVTLKELKQEMVKLQSMNDYVRDLMCDYINSSYTKFEDFMEGKFSDWKFYDEDYDD